MLLNGCTASGQSSNKINKVLDWDAGCWNTNADGIGLETDALLCMYAYLLYIYKAYIPLCDLILLWSPWITYLYPTLNTSKFLKWKVLIPPMVVRRHDFAKKMCQNCLININAVYSRVYCITFYMQLESGYVVCVSAILIWKTTKIWCGIKSFNSL